MPSVVFFDDQFSGSGDNNGASPDTLGFNSFAWSTGNGTAVRSSGKLTTTSPYPTGSFITSSSYGEDGSTPDHIAYTPAGGWDMRFSWTAAPTLDTSKSAIGVGGRHAGYTFQDGFTIQWDGSQWIMNVAGYSITQPVTLAGGGTYLGSIKVIPGTTILTFGATVVTVSNSYTSSDRLDLDYLNIQQSTDSTFDYVTIYSIDAPPPEDTPDFWTMFVGTHEVP